MRRRKGWGEERGCSGCLLREEEVGGKGEEEEGEERDDMGRGGGGMGEEEERARGTVCLGTGWPAGARSREEEAAVAALGAAAAETSIPATQRLLRPEKPQSPGRDGAAKPGERGS